MLSIKKIGTVGKRYRNLIRYRQIIGIILKYGFDNILGALDIDRYIESGLKLIPFYHPHERVEKLSRNQRIRMALEELGPTFVKMGQVLSSRPDLIPMDLVNELSKLQDEIPAFGFDRVKETIAAEFGKPWDAVFHSMDDTPFACASIGQVHRASVTGEDRLAVKIQRPGIRKMIEADLEIIHHLAGIMERNIEEVAFYRPVKIVEEFAKTMEKELDYTIEAASMERMARQFHQDKTIHIPQVYPAESSERVLTMEFINGIKASDIDAIDRAGLDRKRITRRGADFIMTQVFQHGFFHADPHPGNIFIMENNRICPVDFGMTGFLDINTRELFVDIIHAVATNNPRRAARVLCDLCGYETQPDMIRLEKDVALFISVHLTRSLKNIKTSRMVNQFIGLCTTHSLRIPPDLFLMMKAFVSVENVARKLDPDFNMLGHAAPYVTTARFLKFSPSKLAEEMMEIVRESYKLIQHLPTDTLEILRLVRQGKMKLLIDIQGLDKLIVHQDQTSNRISFSIIIAALILGSAIVINSDVPPMLFGVSVIGIAGFLAAGIMGIWLLVAIVRKGRL
ncbi:MAG: AarF/ABC1/UbiB kinase family protein [Desulfotignum sp.]|nr:AarF/ABC1/UbiB kinase family protein [Desulfotignum sp.]MCF8088090.1 AarF/ABC1/UbiB kinase family protein [Desulfotignum sp.]MCF8136589.1 AarF/ABC1/UbiB kinase family protein [Desulfotignum sp.]